MNLESVENCLLLILNLAKDAEIKSLTKTELVKYLYLLDYFHAQETAGLIYTNLKWRFVHYGPYSLAIEESITKLSKNAYIVERDISGFDKDGTLYSLADRYSDFNKDFIPRSVRLGLERALRDFRGNLSGLLNFTYFKTEPMIIALPGALLDFSECRKFDISAFKPLPMKKINQTKVALLKEKRRSALQRKKEKLKSIVWSGEYDEEYFTAVDFANESTFPYGENFSASIEI